jgi:hypothetical protein
MTNEPPRKDDVRTLWQGQQREITPMSVETMRLQAGKYGRKIEWRNAREYAAAFAVFVYFAFVFIRTNDVLARLGSGLLCAGVLLVAWHLHRHGTWRRLPEELGLASSIEFQRQELARQRDLLRGVWRWYLGPMIPGLALMVIAGARANRGHLEHPGWLLAGEFVVFAGVFLLIGRLNERGARRLQERIDELDRLR